MNKYFFLFFLTALAYPKPLHITPEFTYEYASDSKQYAVEGMSVQDFELTFNGKYERDRLSLLARMGYHFIDGMIGSPSDFTRAQGLNWVEHPPGIGDDQRNYYVADMKLQYGDSSSYFYFNKWDQRWGPGVNSLIISDKIPRFFHFGFQWQIKENIRFKYFHGKLKSGIHDENYTNYYSELGSRSFDISRNIAGHRLEWQPFEKFIISGSELVTYANRSIELTYLLPFVPFFPIQAYVGETDNVIMSGDIQYMPQDNIRLFGVFLMDEWSPPYTFEKDNRNWFGWQTGLEWKNLFLIESSLHMEFTWTDHRIYRHRFHVNDFYSWGYPVGFWVGPHAEELYADYSFNVGGNHIKIMFSDAKRGVLTDSLLIDQYDRPNDEKSIYERFSEGTEEKQVLLVSVSRNITDRLIIKLSYTYADWKNAGNKFNTNTSELILDDGIDIIKHSLGFGLQYRY